MYRILHGDSLATLRTIADKTARTCVTSPPYYGLRDYGEPGQIGLEQSPDEYVARLVEVFREVRRVLTDDGTLWLNLGDSYAGASAAGYRSGAVPGSGGQLHGARNRNGLGAVEGLKPKDLIGIPWRVAFALQADGWYLRSDIIWHKPNAMPESVRDRPTKAHEYLFLLAKSERYYYDADAVREPHARLWNPETNGGSMATERHDAAHLGGSKWHTRAYPTPNPLGRNRRTVWSIATKPYKGAHFAVFPPALVEPCILAGSAKGDTVLDPFAGSGTTGEVALQHGRWFVGCELNADYIALAEQRLAKPVQAALAAD